MREYHEGDLIRIEQPIMGAWSAVIRKVRQTPEGVELEVVPFYTAEGARDDSGRFTATEDGRHRTVPISPPRET